MIFAGLPLAQILAILLPLADLSVDRGDQRVDGVILVVQCIAERDFDQVQPGQCLSGIVGGLDDGVASCVNIDATAIRQANKLNRPRFRLDLGGIAQMEISVTRELGVETSIVQRATALAPVTGNGLRLAF